MYAYQLGPMLLQLCMLAVAAVMLLKKCYYAPFD